MGCWRRNSRAVFLESLRLKPLDLQFSDRDKVLGVTGEEDQIVFDGTRGNERIAGLQTVGECVRVDELHRPLRNAWCQRQNFRLLDGQSALNAFQLTFAAAPLYQLKLGDRRNPPRGNL